MLDARSRLNRKIHTNFVEYKIKWSLKSVHIHINLKIKYKNMNKWKTNRKPVCCVQCYIVKLVWLRKLFSSPNRTETNLANRNIFVLLFHERTFSSKAVTAFWDVSLRSFSRMSLYRGQTTTSALRSLSHVNKLHNYLDRTSTVAIKIVVNW